MYILILVDFFGIIC